MKSGARGFLRFRAAVLGLGALAAAGAALGDDVRIWTRHGPQGVEANALAIDPSTPARVYAGTTGGVFRSDDSGRSWSSGSFHGAINAVAVDPSAPGTLYAGTSGGVLKSTDGGDSWSAMNSGLSSLDVVTLAIDPRHPATLYAGTFEYFCEDLDSCLFKTLDGGNSWSPVRITGPNPYPVSVTIDAVTSTTLYVGTLFSGVFKSIDGGASWTAINAGLTNTYVPAVVIDPSAPATLYAATATSFNQSEGGVFKSTDGGASWSSMSAGLPNKAVQSLAIDPSAPGTLYAGTIGRGVYTSHDGGQSWTEMNAGLSHTSVFALAVDPAEPARVYAGTPGAVFAYEKVIAGSCAPDATTLCLNAGRFEVRAQWTTRDGSSGAGQARTLTEDTGYFTFFDPDNVEVIVKVLNGCGANGNFWIFAGGLTNVGVVLTVTDSQTGAVDTYTNPQGTPFQAIQDTLAFASCAFGAQRGAPAPAGEPEASLVPAIVSESFDASVAPCVGDATTLCLNGSRFKAQAQWSTRDGRSGAGQVIPLTDDSGAFWFFDENNVEVAIKVLNACSVNARDWVFVGGLTNVDVTLTVTDTELGAVKIYSNAQGTAFPPIQDTNAFEACP